MILKQWSEDRMYFVDRDKIEETLLYMEQKVQYIQKQNDLSTEMGKLSYERCAHVIIESILDCGNAMIDGFIMRDPGSYEDIIDIFVDEKVITKEMEAPLKDVVALRKMIVREFTEVDIAEINTVLQDTLEELREFPHKVRYYLENELGPVSAFLPEDK